MKAMWLFYDSFVMQTQKISWLTISKHVEQRTAKEFSH